MASKAYLYIQRKIHLLSKKAPLTVLCVVWEVAVVGRVATPVISCFCHMRHALVANTKPPVLGDIETQSYA